MRIKSSQKGGEKTGFMGTGNGGETMGDAVFTSFLERQLDSGLRLAAESDLLDLVPLDETPPQRYIARFRCRGLVRTSDGEVAEADDFGVGISFPDDYLRRADPVRVITWFGPRNVFFSIGLVRLGLGFRRRQMERSRRSAKTLEPLLDLPPSRTIQHDNLTRGIKLEARDYLNP